MSIVCTSNFVYDLQLITYYLLLACSPAIYIFPPGNNKFRQKKFCTLVHNPANAQPV